MSRTSWLTPVSTLDRSSLYVMHSHRETPRTAPRSRVAASFFIKCCYEWVLVRRRVRGHDA